ncbi:MAG: CsgG/HfaB family protein [Algisphaera sp.]
MPLSLFKNSGKTTRFAATCVFTLLVAAMPLTSMAQETTAAPPAPAPATETPATTTPVAAPATPPVSAAVSAPADRRLAIAMNPAQITEALRDQLAQSPEETRALHKICASLNQQLIDRMQNTGAFRIVARADLEAVMKDQELQSVFTNPNDANLPKAFAQSAAKYLVQTTLDDFADQHQTLRGEDNHVLDRKRELRLSATLKIYNVTTGELHTSETLFVTQNQFDEPIRGVESDGDVTDRLSTDLAATLASQVANRVLDKLFPARVIAKTAETITLNRGQGTGIAVGQSWTIFAVGQTLIDPYTGVVLGAEEVPVGKAIVFNVTPRFSQAKLEEDFGVNVTGGVDTLPIARLDRNPHADDNLLPRE